MRVALLLLAGLVAIVSSESSDNRYHGYKVLTVRPQTADGVEIVRNLTAELDLDQWTYPRAVGAPIDIMMTEEQATIVEDILVRENITFHVTIDDVQRIIDEQTAQRDSKPSSHEFDHTAYHPIEAIYAILSSLPSKFSNLVTNYVAGTTYEGRDIRVTAVSSGGGGSRDAIWIDCGIHALEWGSPATCLWILDQLTSGYHSDSGVKALLDTYDFHIMTVTNPDGYAYTWSNITQKRLWRKNRVRFRPECYGADPNRNFDSNFGGPGSSNNTCNNKYHGPHPFSEKESSAVRDSVQALGSRLKMFISIHSYSQFWMTPYSYTEVEPSNYDEQYRVAGIGVRALTAVHGTPYTFGNKPNVNYLASGVSNDWAYDSTGVQYAFAISLRDEGPFLPPDQIIPTGEEIWAGIMAAIEAI